MDAQLAVDKILETENLTDGLDDDAANWLLDWGTEHVKPLIAGIADDDAAGDKVNELMAVIRKINQIVADRAAASDKELTNDIHSFIKLYSKAFGKAQQPSDAEQKQMISSIKEKSPQDAIQAILALVEPTPTAPDPGKAADLPRRHTPDVERRLMSRLWGAFKAFAKCAIGIAVALVCLEGLLHLNPELMLKGMPLEAPVDPPLTSSIYNVYASDGDAFYWNRDIVAPLPAGQDRVVATVDYQVDEFGFPNAAPLPASVDVAVLGRSYSMGAQAAMPWPRLLGAQTSMKVLNLSQPGGGLDIKTNFYWRFAAARHPHWVIVEILPSEDIIGFSPAAPLLLQRLEFPVLQALVRQVYAPAAPAASAHPIYPLDTVLTSGVKRQLTFFPADLAAVFADADIVKRSSDWLDFTTGLLSFSEAVHSSGVCVALLYVPTKPEVYVPLIADKDVLTPALAGLPTWDLDNQGFLTQNSNRPPALADLQNATDALRPLLSGFAAANHLAFIDPTASLRASALNGVDPFLPYDTHWSATGHAIVAQQVADALQPSPCE